MNNNNPWNDEIFDNAFSPMFADSIVISGKRPLGASFVLSCDNANTYPPYQIECFDENSEATTIRAKTIMVKQEDLTFSGGVIVTPQIGDVIDGNWRVNDVNFNQGIWEIQTRELKNNNKGV